MSQDQQGISVQAVAEGVQVCLGPGGLSNTLVAAGKEAVLVADTQLTPGLGRQVKAVAAAANKPIRFVLNTHGDTDHVFGNQEFWPEGVLMGHALTRERVLLGGEGQIQHAIRQRPHLRAELERVRIIAPEVAFDGNLAIDLGGLLMHCLFVGPAHTPGDVVVWLPDRGVLLASDLVFNGIFPVMRSADLDGWLRALDRLEELDAKVVVPGHGTVGDKDLLGTQRELLIAVREGIQGAAGRGLTLEQALEEVRFPQYEAWPKASDRIPEAIRRLYESALQRRQS